MDQAKPMYSPMTAIPALAMFALGAGASWLLLKVNSGTPQPIAIAPLEAPTTEILAEDSDSEDIGDSEVEAAEREPYKMLLIVRNDLKMGKGKACAQCGHATLGAYKAARKADPKGVRFWSYHGQAKVVVKVESEEGLNAVKKAAKEAGVLTHVVHDAGRTQIAAGSRTVLALGPAPVSAIDAVAGHLKLY